MGFFDYVADLYAAASVREVEAEEPQYQGVPDKSGEQSDSQDTTKGGIGTAQHDRGATTRGGVSTSSPASGTDEESDSEKEVNAEDGKNGGSDDGEDVSTGSGAVPDTDDDEEEEEEDEDEPKDPKPRFEEECMKNSQCSGLKHHYDECAERVQKQIDDNGKPDEDCVEEYFHLMHCATQCASAKLFRTLR